MFDTALHRRVALVIALVALVISGASAGAGAPAATSDASASDTVADRATQTAVNATLVYDGDRLVLRPTENQTVRVRTDAEPGRELVVWLQGDTFLRTQSADVGENGTATATFDLSDVGSGTNVTVEVTPGDATTEGLILGESESPPTAETEDDEGTITVDDEQVVVTQAENQRVRLETDADPGTEVMIVAKADTFLRSTGATVAENGTVAATFDFSVVAAGTEFTVGVRGEGNGVEAIVVTETAAIEGEEPLTVRPGSNLTVRGETTADPGTPLVLSATGAEFLQTETATVSDDGTFVATFEFGDVESGTEFEITVSENATLKSGAVEGTVLAEETNDSAFTTGGTTTPDDGSDGHVDEFGVPGFGVPVALVALVAALAFARRRQ